MEYGKGPILEQFAVMAHFTTLFDVLLSWDFKRNEDFDQDYKATSDKRLGNEFGNVLFCLLVVNDSNVIMQDHA